VLSSVHLSFSSHLTAMHKKAEHPLSALLPKASWQPSSDADADPVKLWTQMREAVRGVAACFPTAIVSGRCRDKVHAISVR
jgi:hypothetical protein